MKHLIILTFFYASILCTGCGSNAGSEPGSTATLKLEDLPATQAADAASITAGQNIYQNICQSCHLLTDKRMAGPGLKGITNRRSSGWILSMITDPDLMIEQDLEAGKLYQEYGVRMPDNNLSRDQAIQIYHFLKSNDSK